jgi:hypothetical protein
VDKVKQFLALQQRRDELEADLEGIKSNLRKVEQEILAEFERDSITSVNLDGRCVYLYRKLTARAKDGDKTRLIEALKACGLHDYVQLGFNTQSVEAYVREQENTGQPIPAVLREALETTELFFVRVRKAANA